METSLTNYCQYIHLNSWNIHPSIRVLSRIPSSHVYPQLQSGGKIKEAELKKKNLYLSLRLN